MPLHRRDYLRSTAAVATLAALTGCQSLLGDDGDGDDTPTDDGSTDGDDGIDAETREQRARQFVDHLAAGEFEAAHEMLGPRAQSQIPPEQLQQIWQQLTLAHGQYVGVGEMDHGSQGGYEILTVAVEFQTGRQPFEFQFADGAIAGLFVRPGETDAWEAPDYADESAFSEHELSIQATDECSLGATLTLPEGEDTVPGVVLVHGNGVHDRDHTAGPNKPFKDLAWGLASRGVAVLRYDKRAAACDVDLADADVDDVVTDDALAAVETIRGQDRVRDEDVFVAGLSIGATLAPRMLARDEDLAGAVMLAPLGRPVPQAMLDQSRYIFERDGELTEAERQRLDEIEAMVEQIRTLDIGDDEFVHLGGREYWRTLTEYDPLATAADVDRPMFLAFGGRDWQVTVEDDRPLWADAIGDREDVTITTYDDLNHLFLSGEGQPGPEEYLDPGNVSRAVVEDLATWISETAGE